MGPAGECTAAWEGSSHSSGCAGEEMEEEERGDGGPLVHSWLRIVVSECVACVHAGVENESVGVDECVEMCVGRADVVSNGVSMKKYRDPQSLALASRPPGTVPSWEGEAMQIPGSCYRCFPRDSNPGQLRHTRAHRADVT